MDQTVKVHTSQTLLSVTCDGGPKIKRRTKNDGDLDGRNMEHGSRQIAVQGRGCPQIRCENTSVEAPWHNSCAQQRRSESKVGNDETDGERQKSDIGQCEHEVQLPSLPRGGGARRLLRFICARMAWIASSFNAHKLPAFS